MKRAAEEAREAILKREAHAAALRLTPPGHLPPEPIPRRVEDLRGRRADAIAAVTGRALTLGASMALEEAAATSLTLTGNYVLTIDRREWNRSCLLALLRGLEAGLQRG